MQRLAETCKELGYLFSLHDQYRDYYIDAPSYDVQFAVHEEDAAARRGVSRAVVSVTGRKAGFHSWTTGKVAR